MTLNDSERDALIAKIEAALRGRMTVLEIKPRGDRAKKEEAAFLSGAMTAIDALIPNVDPNKISAVIPVKWIMSPMRGLSVLDA